MSQQLITALDDAISTMDQDVTAYRNASPDIDAFDFALAICQFDSEWHGEVGGYPMSEAFEYARTNSNEFDSIASEYDINYSGDITDFVARAYEFILYQRYTAEHAESLRNAKSAFEDACSTLDSLLNEVCAARPDEFIAIREKASEGNHDNVFEFIVNRIEEGLGFMLFHQMLDACHIDADELEEQFDQMAVAADEYLIASVSAIGSDHKTHVSL